jgi:hypothetical protein
MMAGMNRVFSYENWSNPLYLNKAAAHKKLQSESNRIAFYGENDFATNGNDGQAMLKMHVEFWYGMAFRIP